MIEFFFNNFEAVVAGWIIGAVTFIAALATHLDPLITIILSPSIGFLATLHFISLRK